MRGLAAPLVLALARARRRPGRWLLPALGIALAASFLAGVAAEGAVAGDQGAHTALAGLSPLDRTVRVTWQGVLTPSVERTARRLLRGLGLGAQTEVVLLNPVRLGGVVVRPAAIDPLSRWLGHAARRLGRCEAADCPVLEAGTGGVPATLATAGARLRVQGASPLASPVPLAFSPLAGGGPPAVVTGDATGLAQLPGLSGVYRTYSWLAPLAVGRIRSWQLRAVEERLVRLTATLQASGSEFSVSAPFAGLDAARAQADAAPGRLLLVGGGAVSILGLFTLLAAAGLRRDQLADVDRLRRAGARSGQCGLFVAAESAWICAVALLAGAGIGLLAAVFVSSSAGEPVGGVLAHSLLTPVAAAVLGATWLVATLLMTASALARDERVLDVLAILALAVLVVALSANPGGGTALAVIVAPLCCLVAGVVTFRLAGSLLRLGERVTRDGSVGTRLAFVGLARAPSLPSAVIAFIAVSVGLGGFSLAYRATLSRGAADQAADRVPLDATVAPGPDFNTPLALAPLARWRALAHGSVLPVRRTEAGYSSGAGVVTIPALGVPASAFEQIHGWRASDGSAPLAVLAGRLRPRGTIRVPGPELPVRGAWLALSASSPATAVLVTAALRDPAGTVTELPLGTAASGPRVLRARMPPGQWELEALELTEPTGLEITDAHQNAEGPGATTEQSTVTLGPMRSLSSGGRELLDAPLGGWRAVGATAPARPATASSVAVVFDTTGQPGVVRPAQPSDTRPVPVLADPQTAGAAGPGGRIGLTVDGQPVLTRVVGELRRFPTLPAESAGFVVADEATLSSALDAQLPGQGRADELWVATTHPRGLRAALGRPPYAQLVSSFRDDTERELRAAPLARSVLGTLIAASAVSAALAVIGLLAALLGPARDRGVERDLEAQGIGPRGLRAQLRRRLGLASALGVCAGLVIAVLLVRLAVAAVRAATTLAVPHPGLVTVVPWAGLAGWGLATAAALLVCGSVATRVSR